MLKECKIIWYTCNFGGYDEWDYPEGTLVFSSDTGGRHESRFYKINSHFLPPHDISIYFDASRKWKCEPKKLAEYMEKDWMAFIHPIRRCAYQELNEVEGTLANRDVVREQKKRYNEDGFPELNGLYENSIIVRANNDRVKKLNEAWWEEYNRGCQRDQTSLPYVFWKHNYKPQRIQDSHRYAVCQGHNKSRHV